MIIYYIISPSPASKFFHVPLSQNFMTSFSLIDVSFSKYKKKKINLLHPSNVTCMNVSIGIE